MLRELTGPRPAVRPAPDAGGESDDALVVASLADESAFHRLHDRYAARVFRYVRLRSASDDDAADLTQTVFLKVWLGRARYRPGKAPFAAYLFTIARNALTDMHRRSRPTLPWEALPDLPDDRAGDPESAALRRERLSRLNHHLRELDPQKRELLALRFAAGLTSREIAEVVGKKEEAVKRQLTRIIDALEEKHHDDLV